MLDFELQQLQLGETNFLPLPKLGRPQLDVLARRLEALGFVTSGEGRLVGSKKGEKVTILPSGLARSRSDLLDVLGPAIPELLKTRPAPVPLAALVGMYYGKPQVGPSVVLRLKPRLESARLWRELRIRGLSGLSPDEAKALTNAVGTSGTVLNALSDYPRDGASIRQLGRRLYFSSPMPVGEFISNLATLADNREKNAYPPQSGLLEVEGCPRPPRSKLLEAFNGLGTWCFFTPKL